MKIIIFLLFVMYEFQLYGQFDTVATFTKTYKSGEKMEESRYVKLAGRWKIHGVSKRFYISGELYDSCYFNLGLIKGQKVDFDKKGNIIRIEEYIGDKLPRKMLMTKYISSGDKRILKEEYLQKDTFIFTKEGKSVYYDKKGFALDSTYFSNGLIKKYRKLNDKKGRLIFEEFYETDTLPRKVKFITYYKSGKFNIISECKQIDTIKIIKDGLLNYYYKNGNIMDSCTYKNNNPVYRARFSKRKKLQFEYIYNPNDPKEYEFVNHFGGEIKREKRRED